MYLHDYYILDSYENLSIKNIFIFQNHLRYGILSSLTEKHHDLRLYNFNYEHIYCLSNSVYVRPSQYAMLLS